MRLWSIHPKYLDSKGLLAVWREGLLAKAVIGNKTKGYKNHPQLIRFNLTINPVTFINEYLFYIFEESKKRGYNFDFSKINIQKDIEIEKILVSEGQISYEFKHLLKKLETRNKKKYEEIKNVNEIDLHPLFIQCKGGIATWEKI